MAVGLAGQNKDAAPGKPEYFDEPNFIVAGVTDASNRGGHGADPVSRSADSLAKATAALSSGRATGASEKSLRDALAKTPNDAALHHALAEVQEKSGQSVEALREYQRAAELEASEQNIFDLGDELLTHRAAAQAEEIFTRGCRLFPKSARMLLGLAVACYSQGAYDRAREKFFAAADLNPGEPMPYLFLGKAQSAEITQSDGFAARMERFAKLHPENAWANYYYAVSIWRRAGDAAARDRAQMLLEKAVRLEPGLAAAWLELGIVYADRKEDSKAIAAWQRAVAADSKIEEAHYRLGLAYRRIGEVETAKKEMALYEAASKEAAAQQELERGAVKQFVFDSGRR
jgi:tetratricopeptide (TPR) repeat protein